MEQSDTAATAVVRQLDFTVNFKGTANASARGDMILPDHPQAQLQSKLFALVQSKQSQEPASSQSLPRVASRVKLLPRKMVGPPTSLAVAPRLARPANEASMPKPESQPLLKMDSPKKSREKCNVEQNDGTPKKQKQCSCKNSRCLKLYCECFSSGVYCDGCNCINCHNVMEHEADRKEAIDAILERNPNAFRPKIATGPRVTYGGVEHNRGCNCKKSGCLKRYCECFQANILCSDKCKCMDCKNIEGSEERKAHFHQYSSNSMAVIQQETNAAINGAIGFPSKKSITQQIVFGMNTNKQVTSWPPQFHQDNCLTSDASNFPFSVNPSKPNAAVAGLSKPSYRSPLDGILQSQHVKDLCTLLVEVSAEAAQNIPKENKVSNGTDVTGAELPPISSSHDDKNDNNDQQSTTTLCGNQDNGESDGFRIHNGRPLSPATLALMCDEQDTAFMEAKVQPTTTESNPTTNMKLEPTHEENKVSNGTDVTGAELPPISSSHDDKNDNNDQQSTTTLCGNQDNGESDGFRIHNGRPLSPATLALMCDEQDTAFMEAKVQPTTTESNPTTNMKLEPTHGLDQLYVEQERIVLTRFRNFLNIIITCGSIEETRVERELKVGD